MRRFLVFLFLPLFHCLGIFCLVFEDVFLIGSFCVPMESLDVCRSLAFTSLGDEASQRKERRTHNIWLNPQLLLVFSAGD